MELIPTGRMTHPATARSRGSGAALAGHHAVQFYETDAFLESEVAAYIWDGLASGQSAIAIATPTHRDAISSLLRDKGIDVDAALEQGRLVFLDASETLDAIMADGWPDGARMERALVPHFERALASAPRGGVRLFGEMVDLLSKDGMCDACNALEELGNVLAERYPFAILCAYSLEHFERTADADRFRSVCALHTHVRPAESYTHSSDDERMRQISVLQQRAQALESEVAHSRRLEEQLRQALERERAARADAEAANRAKTDFLAVMSHELRTPLNAIGGYVELLTMGIRGPLTSQQASDLERIADSQRHLLGLINDVLNYARLESGTVRYDIQPVIVRSELTLVEGLLTPQARSRQLTLRTDCPDADLMVLADAEKLRQILVNLLTNAVKFTDAGGEVSMTCRADGDDVTIAVRDTGVGIPRAKLDSIFEPFVQVHSGLTRTAEGTGLGLAISRDIARGMQGALTVTSREGAGSTFTLRLPRG